MKPWDTSTVLLMAAGCVAIAVDGSPVPGGFGGLHIIFALLYSLAAGGLLAWRYRRAEAAIVMGLGALFLASFCRAGAFVVWAPGRRSGIAINLLMAQFAILGMRSQIRWARRLW